MVNSNVGAGLSAIANVFSVVEHWSFIFFTFTNHNNAVHWNGGEDGAHGIDGGSIGPVLVATTHPTCCREGCRFGDSDEFHGEVAFWLLGASFVHHPLP
jgi:hypothetical protein